MYQKLNPPSPTPFFSQDFLEKDIIRIRVFTIDRIVARHQCPWFGFFNGNLERLQIYLPQCLLANVGIHREALSLLFVDGEMLDRGTNTLILKATDVLGCKSASEKGVFRKRLEVAATEGVPVRANGWTETVILINIANSQQVSNHLQHICSFGQSLLGQGLANFVCKLKVKGCG